MSNSIVLMTALVPTKGHKLLIDFAHRLNPDGITHVIISSRSFEPIRGVDRWNAFIDEYGGHSKELNIIFHHHFDDAAPQEPAGPNDVEFWNYWHDVVVNFVNVRSTDYFVASEKYGIDMANVLGCKFMPCDIGREVLPIKGTNVRLDLVKEFPHILPSFQWVFTQKIVLFGQESTGKTTMAKRLAKEYNGTFVPEWARGYLESVGPEVTMEKMEDIVYGQMALEKTVNNSIDKTMYTFYDTDILSTYGYYMLWNKSVPRKVRGKMEIYQFANPKTLYIVMNDSIPFEPDPLRYGGDKRESEKQFWIDLLMEFGCNFVVCPHGDHEFQTNWIKNVLDIHRNFEFKSLIEFKR